MQHFESRDGTDSEVDIKGYFYLIWSSAWLILLAGVLAGVAAYVISVRMTPVYEATTRLLISAPPALSAIDPSSLVTGQTIASTYSEMLLDRPVLQAVIDQLRLDTTPEDLKKKKIVTVEAVTNTQLLAIAAQDPDPQRAADIANAMAAVFSARIRELQSQRYSASREGLAKQVADMEQQITTTSSQIAAIQQQLDASATQTAVSATQTSVAATQTQPAATQTAEASAKSTATAATAPVVADPSTLAQLQARLTQYRTIYASLVTSFEQVRLAEDQTSTNVVVSEPATAPILPVRPRTILNTLLAAVAGMLLAVGTLFAIETLDDTIKDPDEIRRKLGLPILGMIAWHEAPQDQPVALAEPRSPAAESFRSLRTSVMYAAVDRPLRRLMITSPTPEDGKTTVASNLAVVVSQNEKLVLLIDADMRRPQVHRKFNLQNRVGLSELFVQPLEKIATVIQASAAPRLAVLTSGGLPPNPSELLTSKVMGQILDKLDQAFDLIVIDTPPVLSVTDAAALATAMDGVVLVAKPGKTKLAALQQAVEQLRGVNARILGVVLNEVKLGSRKYGYYYGGYDTKYSRYYESGDGKRRKPKRADQTPSTLAGTPEDAPSAGKTSKP